MKNLIKNDLLTLSRQRSTLIELLLMPLVLTLILGSALSGLLFGETGLPEIKVAIVNEQESADAGLDALAEQLELEGYPEELRSQLLETAIETNPTSLIISILEGENLEDLFTVEQMENREMAEQAVESNEIAGYLLFPENFNETYFRSVMLDEDTSANLEIVVENEDGILSNVFISIIDQIESELNLESSVMAATQGQPVESSQTNDIGDIYYLSVEEPVNAFQYYTIGMGVMFALFTSVTIAVKAFTEKELYIYDRIMLTPIKPMSYLMSKLFSAQLIVLGQLGILFIISQIIFSTFTMKMDMWFNLAILSIIYAFVVGSITCLLASVTLYANDATTANFISSFISVLAFLGGSFVPIRMFSEHLAKIGEWTPNGAAMVGYLQVIQGFHLNEIGLIIIRLLLLALVCIIVAIAIFPQRRSA